MRNKLSIIISTLLFLALLSGTTVGCTMFSPIVGKWQDTQSQDTIEFTRGGDVILKASGDLITGKYELIGSDVVKLRLEGLSGVFLSAFGADTWQYEISGDTMTIQSAGSSTTLRRIQ
ncbi:hypothetical protein ES707_16953 [subsurface metagenome]